MVCLDAELTVCFLGGLSLCAWGLCVCCSSCIPVILLRWGEVQRDTTCPAHRMTWLGELHEGHVSLVPSSNVRPIVLSHFNLRDSRRHFTTYEYSECFCYHPKSCYQNSGDILQSVLRVRDCFSLPFPVPSGCAIFPACFYLNSCFMVKPVF